MVKGRSPEIISKEELFPPTMFSPSISTAIPPLFRMYPTSVESFALPTRTSPKSTDDASIRASTMAQRLSETSLPPLSPSPLSFSISQTIAVLSRPAVRIYSLPLSLVISTDVIALLCPLVGSKAYPNFSPVSAFHTQTVSGKFPPEKSRSPAPVTTLLPSKLKAASLCPERESRHLPPKRSQM